MEDLSGRIAFQQKVVKMYSGLCPKFASYFGSQLARSLKNVGPGVQQTLSLCPHCSTPFSPGNTSTRILTRQQLKNRRRQGHVKGHSIYSFIQKSCTSYVVVHCRVCHRCSIVGGHNDKRKESCLPSHHTTPSTHFTTPKSKVLMSSHTPAADRKKAYHRKSECGLKAAIQRSQNFKHARRSLGTPPQLADFLTLLQ